MEQVLLLIDIQKDYMTGGRYPLEGAEAAAQKAQEAMEAARDTIHHVVHIRHESLAENPAFFAPGSEGAQLVLQPLEKEVVLTKHYPNSFRDTGLHELLSGGDHPIEGIVIAGMMTHMCVDTTVRAAFDLGYTVTVLSDACATRALEQEGKTVSAPDVQTAYLAAFDGSFARVMTTEQWIEAQRNNC